MSRPNWRKAKTKRPTLSPRDDDERPERDAASRWLAHYGALTGRSTSASVRYSRERTGQRNPGGDYSPPINVPEAGELVDISPQPKPQQSLQPQISQSCYRRASHFDHRSKVL